MTQAVSTLGVWLFLSVGVLSTAAAITLPSRPNFVFLLCESTDGRLYWDDSPVPIPNIRSLLASGGVRFDTTYANAPVCAASRSSMLSGRYPHLYPHVHNGVNVGGLYNNYEGLEPTYNATIMDFLQQYSNYEIQLAGKQDWIVGGHTEACMLEALTHNVAWPYNISLNGGWNQEDSVCGSQGVVLPGGSGGEAGSGHKDDWTALATNVKFIQNYAARHQSSSSSSSSPFFVYQGMNILHPPYVTSEYWYNKIDPNNVTVPNWAPLDTVHPCELQMSMLRGCTPSDSNTSSFNDPTRIQNIRRNYYSQLAEYDAMVGAYVEAITDAGLLNSTIFVLSADHGDLQLVKRLYYKMAPYEGSAHVPLVIANPSLPANSVVRQPTQLLDLFPTFLNLGGIPSSSIPSYNNGYSLLPFLHGNTTDPSRPDYILSQFHGDDISMSWYMIRQGSMKYINWGNGSHANVGVIPQLFNLTDDPDEATNLWTPSNPIGAAMEATLRQEIDYPSVSMQVAQYELDMFNWWISANKDWKQQLADGSIVRWGDAWNTYPTESMQAVEDWLSAPVSLLPCRNMTAWVG